VLLEFPPIVAAVECAVLMQRMMAERNAGFRKISILYRIGVNLGDVLTLETLMARMGRYWNAIPKI
jgi:adenylate cyclase